MTHAETNDFFDAIVKKLYTNWDATGIEIELWAKNLSPFTWDIVKSVIEHLYTETPARKPALKQVMAMCYQRQKIEAKPRNNPTLDFTLQRQDGFELKFYHTKEYLYEDSVRVNRANELKNRVTANYPGTEWISILADRPNQNKEVGIGVDGLPDIPRIITEERREIIYGRILNGENTPGRRFLERYLNRKPQFVNINNEAKSLGDILKDDDVAPF